MKDVSGVGSARQKPSRWNVVTSKTKIRIRRMGRVAHKCLRQFLALAVACSFALAPVTWADNRTQLRPGWNLFSARQDVEVGQQVSRDAERQLRMLNDPRVDSYVNNLGQRLTRYAPGEKFPYSFRVVNDLSINAFALPGGPVYIHRGVIEAADTESQLAGVMAHEISHVALRHGTNQASKAYLAQVPLAVLGGALGSNSVGAVLAQLGAGFAMSSLLLKYSRSAESQADTMGTQILFDAGYDPRAMVQFFEKIQAEQRGRSIEFFSNHPNPGNRIERVNAEIDRLGGPRSGYTADSREFQDIKRYVVSLPRPAGRGGASGTGGQNRTGYRLRIISASYGASSRYVDVRDRLQTRIVGDRLNLIVSPSTMGSDPYRGRNKSLRVRYEWAGRNYEVIVNDNQRLSIPTDEQARQSGGYGGLPDYPSDRTRLFENSSLQIEYPDNWESYGQGDAATIAPRGGLVEDSRGNRALAYGVLVNLWEPHFDEYGRQLQGRDYGRDTDESHYRLEQATDQLIEEFRQSNANMRIVRRHEDITVDGLDATSTYLSNDSPLGGRETDWLIAVQRPEGLVFIIFTAPDRDFQDYDRTFQLMLNSIRFRR